MPAPLAQPTRCTRLPAILKDAAAVFGRVSVVQMASESSANERADGRCCARKSGRRRRILSTASGTPMTPVEQTNNSCGLQFRRLAASATVRCAASRPSSPVAQFALPALMTTPRMRPFDARRFALETEHRRRDHEILREYRRSRSRDVARKDREIERAGFFQAAGRCRESKSSWKCCFGQSVLHVGCFLCATDLCFDLR